MAIDIIFPIFQMDKPLGPIYVNLIFYDPNVANLGFWKIVPIIAL